VSEEEQIKWDHRYSEGSYRPRTWPSPYLKEWLPIVPRGKALDIASGTGRNALALAEAGFMVTATDISSVAIDMGRSVAAERDLSVEWQVVDLDNFEPTDRYDLITVFRYRNPMLWPKLVDALAPNGWLIAEHHFKTTADVAGPGEYFRLEPQELLRAFGDLRILDYSEAISVDPAGVTYALERLVACNGEPGF